MEYTRLIDMHTFVHGFSRFVFSESSEFPSHQNVRSKGNEMADAAGGVNQSSHMSNLSRRVFCNKYDYCEITYPSPVMLSLHRSHGPVPKNKEKQTNNKQENKKTGDPGH